MSESWASCQHGRRDSIGVLLWRQLIRLPAGKLSPLYYRMLHYPFNCDDDAVMSLLSSDSAIGMRALLYPLQMPRG
jgi:hypothetical protein